MKRMTWADCNVLQKLELIRSVYKPGMSARDIGAAIPGRPSRRAIIAIYGRQSAGLAEYPLPLPMIGNGGGASGVTKPDGKRATKAYVVSARARKERMALILASSAAGEIDTLFDADTPSDALRIPMVDLRPNQCRWAVTGNDVPPSGHLFCGCRTSIGKPYCDYHESKSMGQGTQAEREVYRVTRKAG